MADEDVPGLPSIGSIVRIHSSSDDSLKGCLGEVTKEDPLTISVVHEIQFDVNQVEKVFDASDFKLKHDLVEEAARLGIEAKASETVDQITSKIRGHHLHDGRAKLAVKEDVDEVREEEKGGDELGEEVLGEEVLSEEVLSEEVATSRQRTATSDETIPQSPAADDRIIRKGDCVIFQKKANSSPKNGRVWKKTGNTYTVAICGDDGPIPFINILEEQLTKVQDKNCCGDDSGCIGGWPSKKT